MTVASVLLAEVRAAGVQLALDGGVLRVRVPKGALTAEQRAQLTWYRAEIAALLAEPANDRSCPDAAIADLQALFAADGPASPVATEQQAKIKTPGGPAGDDLASWQSWMDDR